MSHLLVTNDFPPKVGGIQSYLWELWRRLPPGEVTVPWPARVRTVLASVCSPLDPAATAASL